MSQAPVQERPRQAEEAVPRRVQDDLIASEGPPGARRGWDLRPGDHFHGRTIAAVHGVVGLASSPVAVISFTGTVRHGQARVGATHTDADRGHDRLRPLARNWVRARGLAEGETVDLTQLRSDVLSAIAPDYTASTAG